MKLFKYKCPMCGGELDVNEEITVGICQYCNSTIAIPKNLEERSQMYNRAIYLRQNNEFDRAIGVYEDMLKRDNTDVEAHFGLFLSKYGIEYVEDPRTRERKPTCHRLQTRSVYADSDYKAAIEYADPMSRDVYESEAARINAIVKRIQELAANEKPYDIFICYKETDIGDERTEDSRIAQELYQRLERKGYWVFFARKTLENQLGSEYEPVIFSAINTAKVMIVLGTKKEYFNAVWVRNEWSRYIELVAENPEKVLIPVYKNMSAYDLPDELAVFQSQDMGRLGFMEDLQDAIEKILHKGKRKRSYQADEVSMQSDPMSIERKLNNAETYITLGEKKKAEEVYQEIISEFTGDYRGWWGMFLMLTDNLNRTDISLDELQMAVKYAGNALKLVTANVLLEKQNQYNTYINEVTKLLMATMRKLFSANGKDAATAYKEKIASILSYDYRIYLEYADMISRCYTDVTDAETVLSSLYQAYSMASDAEKEEIASLCENYKRICEQKYKEFVQQEDAIAKQIQIHDQKVADNKKLIVEKKTAIEKNKSLLEEKYEKYKLYNNDISIAVVVSVLGTCFAAFETTRLGGSYEICVMVSVLAFCVLLASLYFLIHNILKKGEAQLSNEIDGITDQIEDMENICADLEQKIKVLYAEKNQIIQDRNELQSQIEYLKKYIV